MKKFLTLLLFATIIFTLSACGENKKDTDDVASVSSYSHGVNIVKYAQKGEIPEIPYKLGHDIEKLKTTFLDTLSVDSEIDGLVETQGEKTVWLDGGSVMFCYQKAKKDEGIAVIIAKEYAYDFSMGGVYSKEDIIEAMDGTEYETSQNPDDAFFLPIVPENLECLTFKTGDNILRFVFIDDALSAAMLIDPENWE